MDQTTVTYGIEALFAIAIIAHLLLIGFAVLALAFWIWMITDCATNEQLTGNDKVVWVIIIVFTSWIGALIYFCVQRPKKNSAECQARAIPPPLPTSFDQKDTDHEYYKNYNK